MSSLPSLIAVQNMINVTRLLNEEKPQNRYSNSIVPTVFKNPYGVKNIGTWTLRKDGVYERVLVAPGLQYLTVRNDVIDRKITILSNDMGFTRFIDVVSYPENVTNTEEYSIICYRKSKKHQLIIEMYKVSWT